jgi:hypothetical protein
MARHPQLAQGVIYKCFNYVVSLMNEFFSFQISVGYQPSPWALPKKGPA